MPLEDEFGDVIAKARRGHGLDVATVARAVGIAAADLAAMERYERSPTRSEVEALARLFGLPADRLWDLAQENWEPPAVSLRTGTVTVERITLPRFPVHCFLAGESSSGTCFIVDPGDEPDTILGRLRTTGWRPVAILATHGHGDHVGALIPVQRATGVPVCIGAADAAGASGVPADAVHQVAGDADLAWGALAVRAIHTPGHTPGSMSYLMDGLAFVGDTLFAGSAGGTRSVAAYQDILRSVRERLLRLPPETELLPAHGPSTTVANELAHNPFA